MEDMLKKFQKMSDEMFFDWCNQWYSQWLQRLAGDEVIKQVFAARCGSQPDHMASISPYRILGLEKTDSDEKVKKRFREFAVMLHPDTARVEGTEFFFQMANAAYYTIKKERGWR